MGQFCARGHGKIFFNEKKLEIALTKFAKIALNRIKNIAIDESYFITTHNDLYDNDDDRYYLSNKKGRNTKFKHFGKKTECKDKEYFQYKNKTNKVLYQLFKNSYKLRHFVLSREEIIVKDIVVGVVDSADLSEFGTSSFRIDFINDLLNGLKRDESFGSLKDEDKVIVIKHGAKVGLEHYFSRIKEGLPCSSNSLIMSVVCSSFNYKDDAEVNFIGYFYHAPNCHTPVRTYGILNYCGLSLAIQNINADILNDCNADVADFSIEKLRASLMPLVSKLLDDCDKDINLETPSIDEIQHNDIFHDKSTNERAEEILTNIVYCPIRMADTDGADVEEVKELLKNKNAINLAEHFDEQQLSLVQWGNFLSDNILTSYIDEYATQSLMTPSYRMEAINYGKYDAMGLTKEKLLSGVNTGFEFGSW